MTPFSSGPRARAALIALAALIVVLVIGGIVVALLPDRAEQILDAADAVTLEVPPTEVYPADGAARLVQIPGDNDAVLVVDGLIDPPEGAIYQAWVIGASGPLPAGLFSPDGEGSATVLLDAAYTPGNAIGVTLEPLGGSIAPTGAMLFVGA